MAITNTFLPGALGIIVTLHGQYYAKNWGFGTFFEAKVAHEIAEFASRFASNELVLLATDAEGVTASLILDLNDPVSGQRGAHLRCFISADRCRGTGIGRSLTDISVSHADQHANGHLWLTTFAGLLPARHLYESYGFKLVSEIEWQAWGTAVKEQEFRRSNS